MTLGLQGDKRKSQVRERRDRQGGQTWGTKVSSLASPAPTLLPLLNLRPRPQCGLGN